MSDHKVKRWFLVRSAKRLFIDRIVYANTSIQALERLEPAFRIGKVIQLSWRELSELTGCRIPSTADPTLIATGDLIFRRKGKEFRFCM